MRSTLVGIFETRSEANRARDELLRAGFTDSDVNVRESTATDTRIDRTTAQRTVDDGSEGTIGDTIADWFQSLFGMDDDDVGTYSEAVRRGNTVVTVSASSDERVERATEILEDCGSIDIDERAGQWQTEGWVRPSPRTIGDASSTIPPSAPLGATAASAPAMGAASDRNAGDADRPGVRNDGTGGESRGTSGNSPSDLQSGETRKVPLIEEELQVGKRVVGRRRLRVYTRMVEEPAEETVRLRDEHAHIERRDVDRPATEADYRAARAGSFEVSESSEEPVVSRKARVVGEVEVGKTVEERGKTVRDKVRRTDVDVDRSDAASTPPRAGSPTASPGARGAGSATDAGARRGR